MSRTRRFELSPEKAPEATKDLGTDTLMFSDFLTHDGDHPEHKEVVEKFSPMSTATFTASDVKRLLSHIDHRFRGISRSKPSARTVLVDLDNISRTGACIATAYLTSLFYFKNIVFLYTEGDYEVDGVDLKERFASDDFWYEVFNYPSKLTAMPFLTGRFDASLSKTLFVCGGMDFGRVLHLSARWEPASVEIVYPLGMNSMNDKALLRGFSTEMGRNHQLDRLDFDGLRIALDGWWDETRRSNELQPLLVTAGWKTHAVACCLWAAEHSRVPVFTCLPDFISERITRKAGAKWRLVVSDNAIWA